MNNALHNCKNPYQGEAKKVLCLCSAGLLRSPTTAFVLQKKYGYNTRAAGLDEAHALIPVSTVLLHWADEIVVMEGQQLWQVEAIIDRYNEKYSNNLLALKETPIYVLNVPDMYARMDEELQEIILTNYEEVNDET